MKKIISLILSVLILCSVAVVTPAFAADDTYVKGSVIKVTFTADDISRPFTAMEGSLNFSKHVSLVEDSVEFVHIGDVEFNVSENEILFNSTSLKNYDISPDKVILSAEFNVVMNVTGLPIQAEISDIYYIDDAEFKELDGITLPYKLNAKVEIISVPDTTEPETSESSTSESTTAESTSVSETTTDTEGTETTSSTQNTTDSAETTTATESTAPTTATETEQSTTEPIETTAPTVPTTKPTESPKPTQPTTAKPATNLGPGANAAAVDSAIKMLKNDNDPKGSAFGLLKAKATKVTKNSIKVTWTKVKGAKKYIVYSNKCGKTNGKINAYKKIKETTAKSFKLTKIDGKKLTKGTYYKFLIVAVKSNGKVASTSKTIHVATSGGKVGNYKSVKLNKTKVTLKKGKTFKLKATCKAQSKKLKVKNHRKVKYESSNTKIATVTSSGKIKAKKSGTCYVYAYAQNGVYSRIKVKVK